MAARDHGERTASLRHAELRLILLLEDLERTVDSAERLAAAGLEEDAIRVIDLQRDALQHLPEQVAGDLAPQPRRVTRRIAAGVAAAALMLFGAAASALGVLGDDPLTADDVSAKIAVADGLDDPVARLDTLEAAIDDLDELRTDAGTKRSLSQAAEQAARRYAERHHRDAEVSLADRAEELAGRARSQLPAPAQPGSPLDGLLPGR